MPTLRSLRIRKPTTTACKTEKRMMHKIYVVEGKTKGKLFSKLRNFGKHQLVQGLCC